MLQKRPKWLLFQNSLSKHLKSQKERFRAIFDQIKSDSGLNDPLKTDHFSPHQHVIGDPSIPVQMRRQLATDLELCIYICSISTKVPKNIREAMAENPWIEAMQEEFLQYMLHDSWELVERPLDKRVLDLK